MAGSPADQLAATVADNQLCHRSALSFKVMQMDAEKLLLMWPVFQTSQPVAGDSSSSRVSNVPEKGNNEKKIQQVCVPAESSLNPLDILMRTR